LRQLNREEHPDCDEIVRRYGTDKKDFNDIRIKNISPDFIIENNGEKNIDTIVKSFFEEHHNILDKLN
jgi:hypothetical protein